MTLTRINRVLCVVAGDVGKPGERRGWDWKAASFSYWTASRKKVPYVLSRCHAKRRMGARPSFGMTLTCQKKKKKVGVIPKEGWVGMTTTQDIRDLFTWRSPNRYCCFSYTHMIQRQAAAATSCHTISGICGATEETIIIQGVEFLRGLWMVPNCWVQDLKGVVPSCWQVN